MSFVPRITQLYVNVDRNTTFWVDFLKGHINRSHEESALLAILQSTITFSS